MDERPAMCSSRVLLHGMSPVFWFGKLSTNQTGDRHGYVCVDFGECTVAQCYDNKKSIKARQSSCGMYSESEDCDQQMSARPYQFLHDLTCISIMRYTDGTTRCCRRFFVGFILAGPWKRLRGLPGSCLAVLP